jgi:hypothetical protein
MSHQVEGYIGQGNVLLQRGSAARPLGEAMSQHQRVVGEAQQVAVVRTARCVCHGRSRLHVPDFVGDVVEGWMAIGFAVRRGWVEQHLLLGWI